MFSNYLKMALRGIGRDKTNFLINFIGLTIGFTLFVLSLAYAKYEENYDTFFKKSENIAVLNLGMKPGNPFGRESIPTIFPGIVAAIENKIPEIEAATRVTETQQPTHVGDKHLPVIYRMVDPDFFKMFDLEFITGGSEAFLTEQNIVLLSEVDANKIFGTTDIVGETIRVGEETLLTVRGVYKNLPNNTHFVDNSNDNYTFGAISTLPVHEKLTGDGSVDSWGNLSTSLQSYILFRDGADRALVVEKLTKVLLDNTGGPIGEIADSVLLKTLPDLNMMSWENSGVPGLLIARIIGFLILGIAVLNSVSLSSARMIKRSKEIGLRRVFGAKPKQLSLQFISENTGYAAVALCFSIIILNLVLPFISNILGQEYILSEMIDITLAIQLGLSVLIVGILSSLYPIFLFMGFLKGITLSRSMQMGHSAAWLRKGLVTLQFSVVSGLLLAVIVVVQQNEYLFETSFQPETDKMAVMLDLDRDKVALIKEEVKRLPNVESVTATNLVPFSGNLNISMFSAAGDDKALQFQMVSIDSAYLPQLGIPLLAGRNLDETRANDTYVFNEENEHNGEGGENSRDVNVIVNQSALSALGLSDPTDAIGKTFKMGSGNGATTLIIAGVIPDLRLGQPTARLLPAVFLIQQARNPALSIKFTDASTVDIQALDDIWKPLMSGNVVQVMGMDVMQANAFSDLDQTQLAFLIIAIIAIVMAVSGLYALTAFLAASKRREVGIRKVLGASSGNIVQLLLLQFSKPVFVSLLIGLPLSYYLINTYYLTLFSARIELGIAAVLTALLITLLLGAFTTIYHVLRAARVHPATVLHED